MPFLVEIKKKIGAVQNTRKITKAMELVAASRMKQFQRKAVGTRSYAWGLLDALQQDVASLQETVFGERRETGKVLFVILTSDKGLCGALNQQLIRTLWRSERWKALAPHERALITIGKKSFEAATHAGITPLERFEGLSEQMTPVKALAVIDKILGYWERGEVKEIVLVSPHYVNPFVFHPTLKTYLPFTSDMIETHGVWRGDGASAVVPEAMPVDFHEPSKERVSEALAIQLIETLFLQAFYELKATEYSSRMVAMKNATEAADEMVRSLTLSYNKARQGAITQQLAELTGGSLAIE
ncbi:ATP synthase F1 subunit gamma [Patescibacteria group bacterium]|nr:ATP synthase F1 subunit gamma [Patescibacteria group bacterium]MBP9709499.1 ATP synthase F1 subunit gamma [Patescibacteria group bacterium]